MTDKSLSPIGSASLPNSTIQPKSKCDMIPLIDTHQHLWDLNQLTLSWIKGIELMDRSYLMSDYLKAAAGTGIEKTVYMEVICRSQCVRPRGRTNDSALPIL